MKLPIAYSTTFDATWFIHDWNLFMVRRLNNIRADSAPDDYIRPPTGMEPMVVMCMGRSTAPIKRLLTDCRRFVDRQTQSYVRIYVTDGGRTPNWEEEALRPLRHIDTVHFNHDTKASLVDNIAKYCADSTRRYHGRRGIPYRRGYLLHGPPGTGKTSLSIVLVGLFDLDLYMLNLPSIPTDRCLSNLFNQLPDRCLLVIEDIDAVGIKRRPENPDKGEKGCTLSGLLNVLDGIASPEGRVVIMTSNHPDELDEALVRPGRVDKKVYLGKIAQLAAREMFMRMYSPDEESDALISSQGKLELEAAAVTFGSKIPNEEFTPAQLQGYLLSYAEKPDLAAEEISDWIMHERKIEHKGEAFKQSEGCGN
ncbi:Uu.00g010600.m01.CDS01 [Anthostomella pinea]|uniref:Uu.00g010600.m01.CDS01 n=1 Tax=Anthostomella pinea TaxID=933095 RepID=A0AAI8VRU8_9PEZI|nr:Uu.00g010600.m01.CDS01 [Anthostomella pinea]